MINKTATTINLKNIHLSLRLGQWEFKPGLIPTLAMLVLLPLLLSLGVWQMHRATAKQQLLNQFAQRSRQAPQPLADYEPVYTPVQVTGSYESEHPILLDNRIVNHRPGYDVLVPFIPSGESRAVLINLGWVPRNNPAFGNIFRSRIGASGVERVVGLVQTPQHNLVLAHPKTELHWPLLIEDIRLDSLSRILNRPLYPFILLLSDKGDDFTLHWEIAASVSPARHRAYAAQWFLLALTLLILYFKLNMSPTSNSR